MSGDRLDQAHKTLTEDAARRVVAKALKLQARDGDIRVADLRQAVHEMGVSSRHFDAALADEMRPTVATMPPALRLNASVGVLGGLAMSASLLMPFTVAFPVRWLIMGGLMMWSGGLAWRHRANSRHFHAANGAVWICHTLVAALMEPLVGFRLPTSGWTLLGALMWSFTSVVGMIMHRADASSSRDDKSRPPLLQRYRNAVARAFRWVAERLENNVHYRKLVRMPTLSLP